MLHKDIEKAINDQIKWEFWSGYLYLSMSSWFASKGLAGFAGWMKNQSGEELFHAMKMFDYVNERGGHAVLQTVDAPPSEWKSVLDALKTGLAHEGEVTARINALVDTAVKHKDHATSNFLQWFVAEQVEEEASFSDVVNKLELVGDGSALYMLDKELATRVFTWPAAADTQA
ncbi:Ferritin Dps family protein [Desulfovibrio sp. X2]|uniref:ferritin n=1 Tax=Desulfovibrio sp. X2 TaxID=941449 RepID=UPI000358AD40|nr:ferritin [Desulfovibrio sp. X2]EPR37586.1 Ferritin Dps family protein [Desulfovibrio sp. X2]